MTPYEHKLFEEDEAVRLQRVADEWIHPLSSKSRKLYSVLEEMEPFSLNPKDVPLTIKLFENPRYSTSKFFDGAVDLFTHDCIHVILGRGLLVKDEAFVIGYTMGSTKNISRWRKNLFLFITKYLYPKGYKFGEEERFVFNMGLMAGSRCGANLAQIKFSDLSETPIYQIRKKLGINKKLLINCYSVEKNIFPNSPESQRLI